MSSFILNIPALRDCLEKLSADKAKAGLEVNINNLIPEAMELIHGRINPPLEPGEISTIAFLLAGKQDDAFAHIQCPNVAWEKLEKDFRAQHPQYLAEDPHLVAMLHNMKILYFKGWAGAFDMYMAVAQCTNEKAALSFVQHVEEDIKDFFSTENIEAMKEKAAAYKALHGDEDLDPFAGDDKKPRFH